MKQNTLCFLGLFCALASCPAFGLLQAQCVYATFDDFDDEGIGDPTCGATHTMVTPNWFNLNVDETDWVPWMGLTPTGHTGPGARPDFSELLADGPIILDGLTYGLRSAEREHEDQRSFDPGTYLYVESTDCCGNRAILESDTLDFSMHTDVGMIFAYHMFGANMGSLAMEVSPDGGENWVTVWEEPDPTIGWTGAYGAGTDWLLGGANLTATLAGQAQSLIRLTATVGLGGERSDIAIDKLIVVAQESYPTIHNEGTLTYEEIPDECRVRMTFDKPSDLCPSVDHALESAELKLSLNMGEVFRYGGTDLDGGITLHYTIGTDLAKPYYGPHTLAIADSSQPEQLAIHDFTADYGATSWLDVYVDSIVVGENPDYPEYLEDVRFDLEVDIHEKVDALEQSVNLGTPVIPAEGPVAFSWAPAGGSNCVFPAYRFQLLRLHEIVPGKSSMGEAEWSRGGLTLEVGEPSVELSMMEGSGYYAWRVLPIGDMAGGGAGNDLNWGDYSTFPTYVTSTSVLQVIDHEESGVFEYEDADENKNRTYHRSFSRNVTEDGETLLVAEGAGYMGGSGFTQQTQALSRSQGVAVTQGSVRSYKGMTPLQFMPVPLPKSDLNYEPDLLRNASDIGDYTPANFDAGVKFKNPDPVSQDATTAAGAYTVGAYWSDNNAVDLRIPSAGGYPYSAIETTRDGTNRPLAQGAAGEVRRLQPDGYTTRMKYGAVTQEELIRIFGNEAPNHRKVEKVITISPENVTSIAYIDLMGRTLATCLGNNPDVDESKIGILAPEEGFEVSNDLVARSYGNPYLYEAETEVSFEEEMALLLDYSIEGAAFQSACYTFCRTCDYKVTAEVINLDSNAVVFSRALDVAQQECTGGSSVPVAADGWSDQVTLGAGRYSVRYEVRLNNNVGSSTYLEKAREELELETDGHISTITDPIESMLQDIIAENGTISEFFAYCDANATDAHDDDGDGVIDYYTFDLGTTGPLDADGILLPYCDQIRVDADTCKYDCNPETRDFEAFVTDIAGDALYNRVQVDMDPIISPDEALDMSPECGPTAGICMDLGDGRGWFNEYASSGLGVNWNSPKNIAAFNYDAADGDFNEVIENMIAANEAQPEIYEGYTCLNIYASLESISQNLMYYTVDSSIVRQLLDRVGTHYQDATDDEGVFANSGSAAVEGWKTHPFKYVQLPVGYDLATGTCSDGASPFGSVDLSGLDFNVEADREQIETAYLLLDNCLNGPDADAVNDRLSESSTGTITEDNLFDRWQEICEDILDEKAEYLEEKAIEATHLAFEEGGYLYDEDAVASPDSINEMAACYYGAIMAYAEDLCYMPEPTVVYYTLGPTPNPINSAFPRKHMVDDINHSGGFARTENGEWAKFSKSGPVFPTASGTSFVNPMAWDLIGGGSAAPNVNQATSTIQITPPISTDPFITTDPFLSNIPTEEEMELLTALAMGTTNLTFDPSATSDGTVTIVSQGDAAWSPHTEVFFEDFENPSSSSCPVIPGNMDVCTGSGMWKNMHTGAGVPQIVDDEGNLALALQCGANDPSSPTHVEGNGARTEGGIDMTASDHFELSVRLNFLEGRSIDNLYFIFRQVGGSVTYSPENPSTKEVLYPTEPPSLQQHVAIHSKDVRDIWSHGWQTHTQRFELPPGYYNLYVYFKQELNSDPVEIMLDDLRIMALAQCPIPATLYADFELWDPEPYEPEFETCDQVIAATILDKVIGEKDRIIEEYDEALVESYVRNCAPSDTLTAGYSLNYYQYTLNYYDPLGRLIRTVSPKGVDTTNVSRNQAPSHGFVTEYAYNGLGNLVRKHTPDGGEVNTWFDRLERARFTQTAEDVEQDRFRFVCYDELDRLVRSGVRPMDGADLSSHVDDLDWPSEATDCGDCTERRYIVYDTALDPMPAGFSQENLTNRISYTANQEGDTTAYSYDARGYVQRLYQHAELSAFGIPSFNHIIEYQYDEVTGMVQEVSMNEGREDQFYLRYTYDEDQRMTAASSSSDGTVWYDDVAMEYFPGGSLKRHELGHYGVQGVDFTYNIHGQTIGINLPTEDPEEDPGQDGHHSGDHPWSAPDIFAQQFNYHAGDFSRTGSPFTDGAARINAHDYFDGNLSGVSWMQRNLFDTGSEEPIVGRVYQVDELARLQSAGFSELQSGTWAASAAYNSTYSHDPNGNLLTLTRSDESGGGMDDLTYTYPSGNNRLNHVTDALTTGTEDDVESQSPDNYTYDADGRLMADVAEGITEFHWRSGDKVDSLTLADGSKVRFRYDANGHRVAKITDDRATLYLRDAMGKSLAVYDYNDGALTLAEHVLANGRHTPSDERSLSPITTPSSLQRILGQREHAIHDNVDNVRAVVSDLTAASEGSDGTITGVTPSIISSMDYAPYGSLLTARSIDPSRYRYAFNGKEQDDEVKGGSGRHYDLGARHYDPRIGRMLSIDPRTNEYPWQSPYAYHANQPHFSIDFNGEGEGDPGTKSKVTLIDYYVKGGLEANTSSPVHQEQIKAEVKKSVFKFVIEDNGSLDVSLGLIGKPMRDPKTGEISIITANYNSENGFFMDVAPLTLPFTTSHQTTYTAPSKPKAGATAYAGHGLAIGAIETTINTPHSKEGDGQAAAVFEVAAKGHEGLYGTQIGVNIGGVSIDPNEGNTVIKYTGFEVFEGWSFGLASNSEVKTKMALKPRKINSSTKTEWTPTLSAPDQSAEQARGQCTVAEANSIPYAELRERMQTPLKSYGPTIGMPRDE